MKYLILFAVFIATLECTAYTHSNNPTASGVMPQVGHCAVDKINGQWIPFGTVIRTSDGRVLTVTDRFGDGRNNALDIFMQSENECWQFGRQMLKCMVELP
jgi:3D (Asp-Asp-Asp) domain-containing protein